MRSRVDPQHHTHTQKPGMVVHAYSCSDSAGWGRRIRSWRPAWQHSESLSQKQQTKDHTQRAIQNVYRLVSIKDIKSVLVKIWYPKIPAQINLQGRFSKPCKKRFICFHQKFSWRTEKGVKIVKFLYEASVALITKPEWRTEKEKNDRPMSLTNAEVKILRKTLPHWRQYFFF